MIEFTLYGSAFQACDLGKRITYRQLEPEGEVRLLGCTIPLSRDAEKPEEAERILHEVRIFASSHAMSTCSAMVGVRRPNPLRQGIPWPWSVETEADRILLMLAWEG